MYTVWTDPWILFPAPHKPGIMIHNHNLKAWEVEAGQSKTSRISWVTKGVWGQSQLQVLSQKISSWFGNRGTCPLGDCRMVVRLRATHSKPQIYLKTTEFLKIKRIFLNQTMALLVSDSINTINIINPINISVNCIYLCVACYNKILCYTT